MIKHPQSGTLGPHVHADSTAAAHQVQAGYLSGQDAEIWEVRRRRRRRGRWCQRTAILPHDSFSVCDCVSCTNGTCSRVRKAHHDVALIQRMVQILLRASQVCLFFFFFVNIAKQTALSLCSLSVCRAWSVVASIVLIPFLYCWEDLNNGTFLLSRHHRFLSFRCR